MKWCFYVSQPTICFIKTQRSSQSVNPDYLSPLDHRDVAWEIPVQNNSVFWHQQHRYCSLKALFYAMVRPHRLYLLMKAGNNMSGTRFADFVMCIKSMDYARHTQTEKGHIHTQTPTLHIYTHTQSCTLSQWKGLSSIAELSVCLLMLKCLHRCLHVSPRKWWFYFTAFCTP